MNTDTQYQLTSPAEELHGAWERIREAYADYLQSEEYLSEEGIAHCDELVLHAPGICEYCDRYPARQSARMRLAIAFTGESSSRPDLRGCPAEELRDVDTIHRWGGNAPYRAEVATVEPDFTCEHGVKGCDGGVCDECRYGVCERCGTDGLNCFCAKMDEQVTEKPGPAFDSAVIKIANERIAIATERGRQYDDTWALGNIHAPTLEAVLGLVIPEYPKGCFTTPELRMMLCAALCDVKISRFRGGWREDTALDLGNYLDALTAFVREYCD